MAIEQDWDGSGLEHDLATDLWKPSHAFAILAGIRWDEELYPPDPCFIYYGHVEKSGDGFEWVNGIRELESIASRLEYYWASQSDEGKKPGDFIKWSISKLHRPEWLDWALSERHRPDWRDWAKGQGLDPDKMGARSAENIAGKHTDNPSGDDWKQQAAVGGHDKILAALFDPVRAEALEKMFAANGKWKSWAERANRNGLKAARTSRGGFNPYLAGVWFVRKGVQGWDDAHLYRTLANNLPARSRDESHLLTGYQE